MRYHPVTLRLGWGGSGCVEWENWYLTGGEKGEEPPEIIKRLFNLVDEWQTTFPGTEEYMKLEKEILNINVKNLFVIGAVGMVPKPVMIKNNLRNTPKEGMYSHDFREWMPYQPEQWFFEK